MISFTIPPAPAVFFTLEGNLVTLFSILSAKKSLWTPLMHPFQFDSIIHLFLERLSNVASSEGTPSLRKCPSSISLLPFPLLTSLPCTASPTLFYLSFHDPPHLLYSKIHRPDTESTSESGLIFLVSIRIYGSQELSFHFELPSAWCTSMFWPYVCYLLTSTLYSATKQQSTIIFPLSQPISSSYRPTTCLSWGASPTRRFHLVLYVTPYLAKLSCALFAPLSRIPESDCFLKLGFYYRFFNDLKYVSRDEKNTTPPDLLFLGSIPVCSFPIQQWFPISLFTSPSFRS